MAATWSVLTTVPSVVAAGVAWSHDGDHIAVSSNTVPGFVTIIETTGWTSIEVITVGGLPGGIAWSPDDSFIAVSNGDDDSLSIIETTGWTVVQTVLTNQGGRPQPFQPAWLVWSPDASLVAVCGQGSSIGGYAVRVFETTGWTITDEAANTLLNTHMPIFTADGSQLIVSSFASDRVIVIETSGWTITDTVSPLDGAFFVSLSSDESLVAVAVSNDETVAIIETTGWTVTETIPASPLGPGNNVLGVVFLPDQTEVLCTNTADDSVFVIETTGWTITQNVTVGTSPFGIDASPDSQHVAVANVDSASVSILEREAPPAAFGIYLNPKIVG